MTEKKYVENYYQGIYLTETILGNPNGDFVDNSPRNIDGNVFTTDKCIKYNIRSYIHNTIENIDKKENIVFFYPRLIDKATQSDAKYQTRSDVFNYLFKKDFDKMVDNSPDVRMFGGTFTFDDDPKQIYGPIQLSYGVDLNNAQILRHQIGSPFSNENGKQKSPGSEAVVDDAIISYDITINPNSHPDLLLENDLDLFKKSLWFGTNSRTTSSKKTNSKLLILIKFKSSDSNTVLNIGEINQLICIDNKNERNNGNKLIKVDTTKLNKKLEKYEGYIESIEVYQDSDDVEIDLNFSKDSDEKGNSIPITYHDPTELLDDD
ncbi:hypothetical protein MBCUT_04040 [Methanobrevibacter cuticularis]|uniref:CRISPR-associated protein n=1 Tax=Methanobrevibacter cuticularis TaxID=47311 RepID=A0A166ETP5_9EURY|nr:type I CRISPR-associated protein Cas7 [Methanobrevibacter cuticularis]KZX17001.1 hypothetical protein MBCUT_04040 [Methanobrevibacter cuticularis]